jgi:hypothetical protein
MHPNPSNRHEDRSLAGEITRIFNELSECASQNALRLVMTAESPIVVLPPEENSGATSQYCPIPLKSVGVLQFFSASSFVYSAEVVTISNLAALVAGRHS